MNELQVAFKVGYLRKNPNLVSGRHTVLDDLCWLATHWGSELVEQDQTDDTELFDLKIKSSNSIERTLGYSILCKVLLFTITLSNKNKKLVAFLYNLIPIFYYISAQIYYLVLDDNTNKQKKDLPIYSKSAAPNAYRLLIQVSPSYEFSTKFKVWMDSYIFHYTLKEHKRVLEIYLLVLFLLKFIRWSLSLLNYIYLIWIILFLSKNLLKLPNSEY